MSAQTARGMGDPAMVYAFRAYFLGNLKMAWSATDATLTPIGVLFITDATALSCRLD